MEIKLGGGAVKEMTEKGEGVALIATLNVPDEDDDVTLPGAFGEQHVQMVPAHDWGASPIGKARLHEEGEEVHADFRINRQTTLGRDWYEALRFDLDHPPARQEWSYGFRVEESSEGQFEPPGGGAALKVRFLKRVAVAEISPVLKGAGINTRTLALKGRWEGKRAVGPHKTGTDAGPWDGPANERRVRAGMDLAYYRRAYAWQDPEGDPKTKAAWKFIHHFVDGDGNPGDASMRACMAGIAVMNGARGGTAIPEADRKGVWEHLAKHMRDGEMEPPEMREAGAPGVKLADQLALLAWDAEGALARLADLEEKRLLGAGRAADLEALARLFGDIKAAIEAPAPERAAAQLLARNLALRRRMAERGVFL